ncbi:MAG: hypothetical protein Q4E57_07435 [Eubacteriales bacterium]|nr:hypothetical protein [Eubacteriales bacterium]
MKKFSLVTLMTLIISAFLGMSAFAGWENTSYGWRYFDGYGYLADTWQWIDGNGDGYAECYCFSPEGYMYRNCYVDNEYVNADGAWTVNGVIQRTATGGTVNDGYNIETSSATTRTVYVELYNYTGSNIAHMYLSGANRDDWGADILGGNMLYHDDSAYVTCNVDKNSNRWDLLAITQNGGEYKFLDLNFAGRSSLSVNLVREANAVRAYVVN